MYTLPRPSTRMRRGCRWGRRGRSRRGRSRRHRRPRPAVSARPSATPAGPHIRTWIAARIPSACGAPVGRLFTAHGDKCRNRDRAHDRVTGPARRLGRPFHREDLGFRRVGAGDGEAVSAVLAPRRISRRPRRPRSRPRHRKGRRTGFSSGGLPGIRDGGRPPRERLADIRAPEWRAVASKVGTISPDKPASPCAARAATRPAMTASTLRRSGRALLISAKSDAAQAPQRASVQLPCGLGSSVFAWRR